VGIPLVLPGDQEFGNKFENQCGKGQDLDVLPREHFMSYQHHVPRILVMDHEPEIRLVLRHMLEHAGYRVLEAPDGNVGIMLYRQNRCELVIVDIIMPVKEGISTIIELRRESRKVKIIAISGGQSWTRGLSLENNLLQTSIVVNLKNKVSNIRRRNQ
jgi:CheY-like chemotaxis protein